ncbi:hypothetical protein K458DRAFT_58514 [Lentithecium fluviatile CBS 122367]|uniref:Uncharacterized protein n=1 Tax=Lentithecium fluviatile CBS 122367 TaxID=1168545 RepID=A0A6G1IW00_9PLEO|nr:hypothetical protein K458DRAFT_58514 [Lentithecium fluviatile CBS 122367]
MTPQVGRNHTTLRPIDFPSGHGRILWGRWGANHVPLGAGGLDTRRRGTLVKDSHPEPATPPLDPLRRRLLVRSIGGSVQRKPLYPAALRGVAVATEQSCFPMACARYVLTRLASPQHNPPQIPSLSVLTSCSYRNVGTKELTNCHEIDYFSRRRWESGTIMRGGAG